MALIITLIIGTAAAITGTASGILTGNTEAVLWTATAQTVLAGILAERLADRLARRNFTTDAEETA